MSSGEHSDPDIFSATGGGGEEDPLNGRSCASQRLRCGSIIASLVNLIECARRPVVDAELPLFSAEAPFH